MADGQSDQVTCIICCHSLHPCTSSDTCEQRLELPCGHSQWHRCCVEGWLVRQQTCPICRAVVVDSSSDRIMTDESDDAGNLLELLGVAAIQAGAVDCEAVVRLLQAVFGREVDALDENRLQLERQLLSIETELNEHQRIICEIQECRSQVDAIAEVDALAEERVEATLLAEDSGQDPNREETLRLLARVAAAVQRSGLTAEQVFRSLPQEGAPLHLDSAMSLLSAFGGATEHVVTKAAQALDINASGWVEEEDFVNAMYRFALPYTEHVDMLPDPLAVSCA